MLDVRSRYLEDSVVTVGPARLLTMLYDRLQLDIHRGAQALELAERAEGSAHLAHARDIVSELMGSLDQTAWSGGPRLMSVYAYLFTELGEAGTTGDAERARTCLALVEPLASAWHEAASALCGAPVVPTQRAGAEPGGAGTPLPQQGALPAEGTVLAGGTLLAEA